MLVVKHKKTKQLQIFTHVVRLLIGILYRYVKGTVSHASLIDIHTISRSFIHSFLRSLITHSYQTIKVIGITYDYTMYIPISRIEYVSHLTAILTYSHA